MTVPEFAVSKIGCPYIFGYRGETCTPDHRITAMKRLPGMAQKIKLNCPVLSGKQKTCSGCKYNGKPAYDCRGLTAKAVEVATGRPIKGSGATSQWNDASNWASKGLIKDKPDRWAIVFRADGSSMAHTGIDLGNGYCVHASGHSVGVIKSKMPYSWTHYGIPVGEEKEDMNLSGLKATINTSKDAGLSLWSDKKRTKPNIVVKKGETISCITDDLSGWVYSEYKGVKGYADKQYLVAVPPVVVPPVIPPGDTVTIPRSAAQALFDALDAVLK